MKMPNIILEYLLAPCGMNCMVCYVHLKKNNPCNGCLGDDKHKPERCKACKIKTCATSKGKIHCYECNELPCKAINSMEKSYNKRYATSLIENSKYAEKHGISDFLIVEKSKWTCPKCNGVMSLHDGVCSECNEQHENYSKLLKNNVSKEET